MNPRELQASGAIADEGIAELDLRDLIEERSEGGLDLESSEMPARAGVDVGDSLRKRERNAKP